MTSLIVALVIAAHRAVASIAPTEHQSNALAQVVAAPCQALAPGTKPGDGCIVVGRQELGALPRTSALFWHIDTFDATVGAESAKGPHSLIVRSHGTVWLFTIAGANWVARGGRFIARIGPLPVLLAHVFAVEYVEGDFPPGMTTRTHRHAGVEAFYTVKGETCLETPRGLLLQRAGGAGIMIPGNTPMRLTAVGPDSRFGFAAVLEDASKPFSWPERDWQPRGLCQR